MIRETPKWHHGDSRVIQHTVIPRHEKPRAIRKFLTDSEEITYQTLRSVCDPYGARVFAKVRLVDLLRCYPAPPKGSDLSFSLQAHLDFVVVSDSGMPLFSVEYDGPSHRALTQQRRDRRKDAILRRINHPLLRINSNYLQQLYRGYDLLSYLVDVWFLWESFNAAQARGQVPQDEPFDASSLQPLITESRLPWHLSYDLKTSIRKLHKRGRVIQPIPNFLIGGDQRRDLRCLGWIFITPNAGVVVRTGMKRQNFPAIDPVDLLSHLVVFDLYDALVLALSGRGTRQPVHKILTDIGLFRAHHFMAGSCTGACTVPLGS